MKLNRWMESQTVLLSYYKCQPSSIVSTWIKLIGVCSLLQLAVAAVLTTVYAVVQMMVFVGIIIQIAEEGYCSPTALFFFYVAGTFILAALLHPQEFFCVIHGFLYFLSIPSMYMLLMIYAMTNLHVVSWGTREVGIPQITLANMNQSWNILPDATMSQIKWQDCITQTNLRYLI